MVTVNWIINAHKILVIPVVLALMLHFHNWSSAAFLYLGLACHLHIALAHQASRIP